MIHASFKPVYNFNLYPTCKCSYEMSNIGVTKFFTDFFTDLNYKSEIAHWKKIQIETTLTCYKGAPACMCNIHVYDYPKANI